MKICIVEDEEFIRKSIVRFLGLKGYAHVLEAAEGKEAIALIHKESPEIVFLDIKLSDNVSGIEVLEKCRVFSPGSKIIMMSAYQDEFEQQSKKMGAYGFIKKPVTKIDAFINIIKEIAGQ